MGTPYKVVSQSRLSSFIEASLNVFIGFIIALITQIIIFPVYDIEITLDTHIWIGLWFTAISIIRSYVIRRWFNNRLHKIAEEIAG